MRNVNGDDQSAAVHLGLGKVDLLPETRRELLEAYDAFRRRRDQSSAGQLTAAVVAAAVPISDDLHEDLLRFSLFADPARLDLVTQLVSLLLRTGRMPAPEPDEHAPSLDDSS
jgi:hypothetical protein